VRIGRTERSVGNRSVFNTVGLAYDGSNQSATISEKRPLAAKSRANGPFLLFLACVILSRRMPLCPGINGRIADGREGRRDGLVRTVGCLGRGAMVSGQRIDFYDDPAAPTAASLVPPVNVVVANEAGEILLIRRTDNRNWAVPRGAIEFRESPGSGDAG
jgi:hypothetical protein